ncbi:MAG: hypothetical protein RLZZ94_1839 [Bacteroidota bacterium]|jgi:hypothetical protein
MKRLLNKSSLVLTFILILAGVSNVKGQVTETDSVSTEPSINLEPEDTTQQTIAKMYNDIEFLKRFHITGYVQAQYQIADSAGVKGGPGGDFETNIKNRFSVRRSRFKLTYDKYNSKGVLQVDLSERGVRVVDAYFSITDNKIQWFTFTAGIFNRPFGHEVEYGSNVREAPERGRMSSLLFPNERDLGAKLTIQGPKTGIWNWLKLDLAMVAGVSSPDANKFTKDYDNHKDLIAHLSANRSNRNEDLKYGIGVSYYGGSNGNNNDTTYAIATDVSGVKYFKANVVSDLGYTKKEYFGIDFQLQKDFRWGIFTFKGEYIEGTQPGIATSTKSYMEKPTTYMYSRSFNGAYFTLVQNITRIKSQLILKYDWYDENADVEGDEIGKTTTFGKATNNTDLRYDTFGFGAAYLIDNNTKVLAYYDIIKNESSKNLAGYTQDINDNIFTLRFQYKF